MKQRSVVLFTRYSMVVCNAECAELQGACDESNL